jgi:type VI secretion system protein ImpA
MASPPTLDLQQLLALIPGDCPAGVDARLGKRDPKDNLTALERVRGLRDAAKLAEDPNRVENQNRPQSFVAAEWDGVLSCGSSAIATESKDLRLVSPLIEALVRKHGIAGLRDAFRLTRGLAEEYWETLYPRPDEDDGVAVTVAPLDGLFDGPLSEALKRLPVTNGRSQPSFVAWQYRRAPEFDAEQDAARRTQRAGAGFVGTATIHSSVADTPKQFYDDLLDDLAECQSELSQLSAILDAKCGSGAAPPTSALKESLAEVERNVTALAKPLGLERFKAPAAAAQKTGEEHPENGQAATEGAKPVGRTREGALAELLEIASYFEQHEPHSPIPFALRQVERWGRMSLPDLLTDLVGDGKVLEELFKKVGINKLKMEKEKEKEGG